MNKTFEPEVSVKFEILGRMYITVQKTIQYNIYLKTISTEYTVFSEIGETVFYGTKEEGQVWLNNLTIGKNTTEPNNCSDCGSVAPIIYISEKVGWLCDDCMPF